MQLYIPEIGTLIILKKDWVFDLHYEYRNESLINKLVTDETKKFNWYTRMNFNPIKCTLCANTILKVDRIYIRKGNSDYSSLTFFIKNGLYQGCRFWAKLNDVNQIDIDIDNKKIFKYEKQYEMKFSRYANAGFINERFDLKLNEQNDVINCLYHVIINNEHLYNIEEHTEFIVNSIHKDCILDNEYLEIFTKKDVKHYFIIKKTGEIDWSFYFNTLKECKDHLEQKI